MKPFKLILIFICLMSGVSLSSQVKDNSDNKSFRIPAKPSKTNIEISPNEVKVAPKPNADADQTESEIKKPKYVIKNENKPFSMTETDGLKSPSEIFEKRWNIEAEKSGIIRTMSDQFLGEHNVDTKFVNIICRDHEYPDGDRVEIKLNDEIIKSNLLLTGNYRRVEVNLVEGRNRIDIKALNQGDSGPNTAEFLVYDDKGNLISSKEWNLLTGVKATIVFVNEKVVIKSKSNSEN